MGRELRRVPIDFGWPLNEIWWGWDLDISVRCQTCEGDGFVYWNESHRDCPTCKRECRVYLKIDPPAGEAYQVWETVSEGSPISPPFATPEELARHMSTTRLGADRGTSYETWLAWINGPGLAPSMALVNGKLVSGVEATARGDS